MLVYIIFLEGYQQIRSLFQAGTWSLSPYMLCDALKESFFSLLDMFCCIVFLFAGRHAVAYPPAKRNTLDVMCCRVFLFTGGHEELTTSSVMWLSIRFPWFPWWEQTGWWEVTGQSHQHQTVVKTSRSCQSGIAFWTVFVLWGSRSSIPQAGNSCGLSFMFSCSKTVWTFLRVHVECLQSPVVRYHRCTN